MATTIQKRGRRHTAAVRYKGAYACSTFSTRLLAEQWADRIKKEIEHCLATGVPFVYERVKTVPAPGHQDDLTDAQQQPSHDGNVETDPLWSFMEVSESYLHKVSMFKKSSRDERNRIKQLQASILAQKPIKDITSEDVYEYLMGLRHHRTGKPLASVSIRNMAFLISSIFNTAKAGKVRGGFGISDLTNPIPEISLPTPPKTSKHRNIDPAILNDFFKRVSNLNSDYRPWLKVFFTLAAQTGMRRSELIGMRWSDIHKTAYGLTVRLNDTKSGYSRLVYLTETCQKDLLALKTCQEPHTEHPNLIGGNIFPFTRHYASRKFHELMNAIGYPEIRLHDLRHTALTGMANAGFSLKELMAQSGHRTAAVASRYLHVDEKTIRRKFNKLSIT